METADEAWDKNKRTMAAWCNGPCKKKKSEQALVLGCHWANFELEFVPSFGGLKSKEMGLNLGLGWA